MKFIVDGMLGKITRWLRMLGHDVKYSNELDDAKLIKVATRDRRVLLTRDSDLYKQAISSEIDAFYLTGKTEEEKLAELAKRYKIRLHVDMTRSRCPKCNAKVKEISRREAEDRVNKGTFIHHDQFWECPKCQQMYWQGTHWKRIRKTLENAKKILEKSQDKN